MNVWETLLDIIGLVSFGIAVYEYAVIKEREKQAKKMQFLLAGVSHSALNKHMAWVNQINLPTKNGTDPKIMEIMVRARDDFADIVSLASVLEGAIDPASSAITGGLEKSIKTVQLNNQLQGKALENPNPRREVKHG